MKKILILLAIVISAASCGIGKLMERSVSVNFADYRPYTDAGFFISPNAYNQEYDPIGEIYIEIVPGQECRETPDYYGTSYVVAQENITYNEILEMAIKEAIDKGADGLVNLDIKKIKMGETGYYRYEVSGFCIKRE